MERTPTEIPKEAIAKEIPLERAIDLYKFYEETANKIKDRVWTITTWVFSLATGIIGFCLSNSPYPASTVIFFLKEFFACAVGIVLCIYLKILIRDQGNHIQNAWDRSNMVRDRQPLLKEIVKGNENSTSASFPRFCTRLIRLANGFIFVFIVLFFALIALHSWAG